MVSYSIECHHLKEHTTFWKIGSFYKAPRVEFLNFTIFTSIQSISRTGRSTFLLPNKRKEKKKTGDEEKSKIKVNWENLNKQLVMASGKILPSAPNWKQLQGCNAACFFNYHNLLQHFVTLACIEWSQLKACFVYFWWSIPLTGPKCVLVSQACKCKWHPHTKLSDIFRRSITK